MLMEKISRADISQIKRDVEPFVENAEELDIWSNDYFLQLSRMMKITG